MRNAKISQTVVLIVITLILSSCTILVRNYHSKLIIYNISKAERHEIQMDDISDFSGRLWGKLNDNSSVEGNFFIYGNTSSYYNPPYGTIKELVNSGKTNKAVLDTVNEKLAKDLEKSFPELYGFGKTTNVTPQGSATLVATNGLVIEIVFYKLLIPEQIGDGIGKDNKGNFYRVYLVTEEN